MRSEPVLASRAPDGAVGDDSSGYPVISADGHAVAFLSAGANMSAIDPAALNAETYVRDLPAATTVLASRADGGKAGRSPWRMRVLTAGRNSPV